MATVFLLSPARCNGARADLLLSSRASRLAARLRSGGAPLGEVFAWLSMLYFRGKLTYATTFATPTRGRPGALVMAPGRGLLAPGTLVSADDVRAMGAIDVGSDAFAEPLRRDAEALLRRHGGARVVLLGSIATGKYVDPLLQVFGKALLFPAAFVGRGDNSRGGLLLRAARAREELAYVPIEGAQLRGRRPPRLPRTAEHEHS